MKTNFYRLLPSRALLLLGLLLGSLTGLRAQKVIPLGGGSYAEYPPLFEAAKPYYSGTDAWGDLSQQMMNRKWYMVDTTTRPVPTTEWWTSLVATQYSDNLWAYPGMVNAEDYGLYLEFPKRWTVAPDGGTAKLTSRSRLTIGGVDFAPQSALARRWGVWTLDWIMQDATDPSRQFAVTIGHGLPFTWIETSKVTPTISVDSATFFKDDGTPLTFPVTTDHFGIQTKGDQYGIFAPPNTRFTFDGKTITATLPGATGYLVVGTLTKAADLALFNTYAYTIPRDSKVSWTYDEAAARMTATWELVNENLRGGSQLNQIQGWLPHSYKKTSRDFAFNGLEYATPRGKLKCATGNRFSISYAFNGLVPNYTEPEVLSGVRNPYRPEVMKEMIDNYKSVTGYRSDTYWGGKDVLNYARYMQVAAQTGNKEAYAVLHKRVKDVLTDWFTYTPGEDAHFFSLYPNVGSFLGHRTRDNDLPGIDIMQDHAFCYAYHVYAAAILFMYDEEFKAKYKDMAKMLVLDYANYNRADRRFPFFRSMDPWAGHSYSGGLGDFNGNGMESSSESMQAWGAMYLLGEVLGDKPMRDAGIFGYVQEAQAVGEYWFDRSRLPANGGQGNYDYTTYRKPYNSNLTSNGIGWWTYFSGDPYWMHSIQWLPMSPLLKHLYEDVPFAAWDWNTMWNSKHSGGWDTDLGNDAGTGNVAMAYFQISNPDSVAAIFDNLWANNRPAARAKDNNAFTYWYTHAHRTLGEIQWNQHTNLPSSTVYYNARLNRTTVVVYNPATTEKTVDVYKNGAKYASFTAPPRQLIAYKFDAKLTTIKLTAPAKTVPPGQTLQLTAQGYDQYQVRVAAPITWSVSGGGSINASGLFTAGATNGTYTVTATSGAVSARYQVRVGPAPVLAAIAITPALKRAEIGQSYQLTARGTDQYGDSLAITPTWTTTGGGTLSAAGLFTPTTPGGPFTLKAAVGSVSGSLAVSVSYPLPNLALGKPATASTSSTSNPLANLNDGRLDTRWESTWADAQQVTINLGGVFDLEKVVLNWEAAYGKAYDLQISTDGTTFTALAPTQQNGTGGREELAVTGTGQYLRLNLRQRGTAWGYSLFELEAYGSPQRSGPPVLATLLVSPATVVMKDNVTQQFTATGYDQYGKVLAVTPTWQVVGKGSISATGLYTPNGGGVYLQPSFTVQARAGNLVSQATVVVEETSKLMKLDIQPLSKATSRLEMAVGTSRQLTYVAKNQFDVPFTGPITWSVSGGGSINAGGLFTANQVGEWMIFGKNGAVSDTAYVSVKPFAEVNLAAFKPVKTSSQENDDPGVAGRFAVDRNLTTRWASKYADPQWLYVDLQDAYRLNKVVIFWEGAYATAYDVQVANDPTGPWTTVAPVAGADGGQDVLTFPETTGRYVRLWGKTRSGGYGYSLYEFQVFGTGLAGSNPPPITGGTGQPIPGRIEAESFTAMSGVANEPTADAGGGQNVGYIDTNDWLDYAVNVQTAGTYTVQFRVAGWNAGAQVQLKLGSAVLCTVPVPTTGGGQNWTTTSATVTLPAGSHTLRAAISGGGFNFNWMDFRLSAARPATAPGSAARSGFPNPTEDVFYLGGFADGASVVVSSAAGNRIRTATLHQGTLDVRQLPAGLYLLTVTDGQRVERIQMLKK